MSKLDIDDVIIKFMSKSASASELEVLGEWVMQSDNEKKFNEFVKINYAISHKMTQFNTNRTKQNLLQKIKNDKSVLKLFKIKRYVKYAAAAIFLLGLGYFFQLSFLEKPSKKTLVPGENDITLYLEDGGVQIISKNGSASVHAAKGKKWENKMLIS